MLFDSSFSLVFLCIAGCMPGPEDHSINCTKYYYSFFEKPTTVQMAEFDSLPLDDQYAVYICGNQAYEPPQIGLRTPFAKEGARVVGLLKAKLANADGDLTIRDILGVFEEMSSRKTYDVAGDKDLMRVISAAVGRVKDRDWKMVCDQSLAEIRHGIVPPTRR